MSREVILVPAQHGCDDRGMTSFRRALLLPVLAIAMLLGACGDDDDTAPATTAASVGTLLPPVVVNLETVDGTTVDVRAGGTVDLAGDETTYTDWTAKIADPNVVAFVPGRSTGSASFNPGLEAKSPGTTEVTLTNSSSSKSVTFTVVVGS
jgi:hypothetical protein